MHNHHRISWVLCLAAIFTTTCARGDDPAAPAEFTITNQILVPADKAPPIGVNNFGGSGADEYARNNFVQNAGNEPIYWRNLHRVINPKDNSFEIDGGGVSWWDLWGSGFLSGAKVRIYRLVDKNNQPLPVNRSGKNIETAKADHPQFIGETRIIPENTPGFPDGGWVVTKYNEIFPNAWIRAGNLSVTDNNYVSNNRTYYYTVTALNSKGQESDFAGETSATPQESAHIGPRLLTLGKDDKTPQAKKGQDFWFTPTVVGAQGKITWTVVDDAGNPASLPAGLALDAGGTVKGKPADDIAPDTRVNIRVTDESGQSDTRSWLINPADHPPTSPKPLPPSNLTAEGGNGFVTIRWKASPSPDVVGYRLKRSTAPLAKQENRVYLMPDAPKILPYDYITVERKFDNFDLKYLNNRIRLMGNRPGVVNWYWTGDWRDVTLSLVPHPQPIPADMREPGETCMQIRSDLSKRTSLYQNVFIGTNRAGESIWYGQLEPGKKYRFEGWMRQENLAGNGTVIFSFGNPDKPAYPGLKQTFHVTGEWKRFTYDFIGPPRPDLAWHFGHTLTFTGPGTLWIDNLRVFRTDTDEALEKPYVPNATVFDELVNSAPSSGPKGTQRIWLQSRNITMKSLLSWHSNARVGVDWSTGINGNEEMTLPPSLEFCLRTGGSPAERVVPWITLQHLLHTEDDWRGFVEYLCAPYDPATDSPDKKPWAYMRYQQRGIGTPWVDEFRECIIEFGNETWHNGVFDDWLGFSTRGAVWQGGKEYGLFCQYLIDQIKKSPYWRPDYNQKIRFALNDGYGRYPKDGGKVLTYGEEAILGCPGASLLTHANYVGPKWETGDKSRETFDDHGIQATLLAYQTGNRPGFIKSAAMRKEMAAAGRVYDLAAYESGPSGFALGNVAPSVSEVNERYGKSLAIAVAALDAWLDAYQHGWTYQNYFNYQQGQAWSSHLWFSEGFRPSVAWQAMTLRNRYARGDAMTAQATTTPTLLLGKDIYPLTGAYAFRDGRNWMIFVLSRKLDGNHDGHNFGDGSTPVTLRLPFAHAENITLHAITGDPRQSNRDKLNFEIQSSPIPASNLTAGALTANLPPGAIYLYVFENTSE